MHREKIYPWQLFSLIFIFELGSAVLFALGIQAKQDIWIVVILSYLGAVVVAFVYTRLFYEYKCGLVEYLLKIWGKNLGSVISFMYIVFFLILTAVVTRNFMELLKTAILFLTPSAIITLLYIALITYAVMLGIECIARMSSLYVIIVAVLLVIQYSLFIASKEVDFSSILPILEDGIMLPLKTAFQITLEFPFTEIIAFTTVYPMLSKPQKAFSMTLAALTAAAVVIALNDIFIISILGVNETARISFPLYIAITMVRIGFIQNMDALVVIILVINGFFKVAIFYYACVESIQKLFNFKDYRFLLVPLSAFIIAFTMIYGRNYTEHIELSLKILVPYIQLFVQVLLPFATYIVSIFRKTAC
ncbi:spore germination protein KB [Caldanaerobius fijiensis DSM 17918]|uniref:Spore germination protein KB n=1 Tax=Caldanaerobius fijiensis DSM 17918 TaxID=1121256 RepID=A0A1M5DFC6_9THEO|nr:GerAB/ArcD/ProY family transporter [Caldanaerobius fijiensis]SHF65660.1 spore germination protein KB [Caldanaerobius fijiensis DSM 17918]